MKIPRNMEQEAFHRTSLGTCNKEHVIKDSLEHGAFHGTWNIPRNTVHSKEHSMEHSNENSMENSMENSWKIP